MRRFLRQRTFFGYILPCAVFAAGCNSGSDSASPTEKLPVCTAAESAETSKASQPLHFTDVAAETGISSPQWRGVEYGDSPEDEKVDNLAIITDFAVVMTGGASIVDIDSDGFEDIYLTRAKYPNQLFRNNCGNGFVDIAPAVGLDVESTSAASVWGDVNADGRVDLLLTAVGRDVNKLFIQQSDGTFSDEGEERGVGSRSDFSPVPNATYGAAMTDIDSDGDLDLLINQWQNSFEELSSGRSRFLLNDGAGNFTDGTESLGLDLVSTAPFTAIASDINGDGDTDLLLAADFGSARVFLGTPNGTFSDATDQYGVSDIENAMGSALEDFDDDGDLDWFVTSIYSDSCDQAKEFGCTGNRLWRNDGETFTDVTDTYGVRDGGWGWGAAFDDFDNDGRRDLVMTNGYYDTTLTQYKRDPMRFWIGGAKGDEPWRETAEEVGLSDIGQGKSLLPFDYDRDGDLDILISRTGQPPLLYRNDLQSEDGWIAVAPVEASGLPSPSAIVTVERTDGSVVRDEVRLGDTFQGSSSPVVHVGLGEAEVARVEVQWNDGTTSVEDSPEPNQRLVIQRPEA